MIEIKTDVFNSANSRKITELTVTLDDMNYNELFRCFYPMILSSLRKGLPNLSEKLDDIGDMATDAVVALLSSFPDSIKEELIKAAFDDILTEDKLSDISNALVNANIPVRIENVSLNTD